MPSTIRYPAALQPGDLIAVTAPSSGVSDALWPRLEFAVQLLRDRGYRVQLGECLNSPDVRSAPAAARAAELTAMLTDPDVRAVIPPWGGELAIDLLSLLDFDAIAAADPTWLIGYSDLTTLKLPLTLRTGVATMHAQNLMDTPYEVPVGLLSWLDAATAPGQAVLEQQPSGLRQGPRRTSFADNPAITDWELEASNSWSLLGDITSANASGRLIGGCLEALAMLPGTPYGDVPACGRAHRDEGLIVYLEVAEDSALNAARMLHHPVLAGWFEHATAALMGRPGGPDVRGVHPTRGDDRHHRAARHPGYLRRRRRAHPTARSSGQRGTRDGDLRRTVRPANPADGLIGGPDFPASESYRCRTQRQMSTAAGLDSGW